MNLPPDTTRSSNAGEIHRFVHDTARAAGLPGDKASLLAEALTGNDLRGNFSHGSRQIATYARLMRDGSLNPSPAISTVRESPVSAIVDGDGGLGYFPAFEATRLSCMKAKAGGIAITLTRNHGHFGAAGIYARAAVAEGLCVYVTSGHQLNLSDDKPHYSAAGGSPMAFGAPAGSEPSVVLDFGAMHDLYGGNPDRDTIAGMAPGLVLRSIGLGAFCQIWGGFLSGLTSDPADRPWTWPGANQGSLIITFQPELFIDPDDLKKAIDGYARSVRTMQPLPGMDGVYLPGGVEAERLEDYSKNGIPMANDHQQLFHDLAAEFGIDPPATSTF